MGRVAGVLDDSPGFPHAPPGVDVLEGGKLIADSVIPCIHPASIQTLKEQISRCCCKCRAIIVRRAGLPCMRMTLTLSVSCLGKSHADSTLSGTDFSLCKIFSLVSLRSRIAFFSESDSVPRALPFSSFQGPLKKKKQGRGFEQPVTSELTPVQCPRASPSPQREHSPVLFTQHDQRPSAAASDMISFV